MKRMQFLTVCSCLALFLLSAADAPAQDNAAPDIMPLKDVRPGMRGYGLSVFRGATIETFEVEVVSVMADFAPNHGVIWIKCLDDHLTQSGPVSGMSGSPVYLWTDKKGPHKPGQGAKLIGAFAFGYNGAKICYAGVQPIESMLAAASRAKRGEGDDKSRQADRRAQTPGRNGDAARQLQHMLRVVSGEKVPAGQWRLEALAAAFAARADERDAGAVVVRPSRTDASERSVQLPPGPRGVEGQVQPLMLPVACGSTRMAELVRPLLRPYGLQPVAAGRGRVGNPPPGVDAKKIKLEPGSVMAIPLAWGALDISATGTVTHVMPDGRVLGFGHPMFGEGDARLPVASGYVHFVMPTLFGSFKLGGSCVMRGTLVRDEGSAVIAVPEQTFESAAVNVEVHMTGQPVRRDRYHVARHRNLMPQLAGVVAIESMIADQYPPEESTLRIRATMRFDGDRTLQIDEVVPYASPYAILSAIGGVTSAMLTNPYEQSPLREASIRLDVERGVREANIIGGRLRQARVAPGGTVQVDVRLQHYDGRRITRPITIKVPDDAPEGNYQVLIGGIGRYLRTTGSMQPHRAQVDSLDDLWTYIQEIFAAPNDALYAVMPLNQQNLAIGRTELPNIPSSKAAIIASPMSSEAMPYRSYIAERVDTPYVVNGEISAQVIVTREVD